MRDFGTVQPGTTLYIPFATYDSNDPSASVTITGLATTDIEVYKDGSTTQRASDAGYALLDTDGIDFDGTTGIHGISIDLADNTTANFYEAGSQYWVVVASITVDAATINFIAATFRIGYPGAILNTTIATLASQTSFTLEEGPAEDDALNGRQIIIHDLASAVQVSHAVVSDYTGSTRTVTLAAGATFTAAAGDNVSVMGLAPLQPTTSGRTLDVNATGEAGLDLDNTSGTLAKTTDITGFNDLSAAQVNTEVDTGLSDFFTSSAQLVDDIWDEVLTGATHNVVNSAGRRLRQLDQASGIVDSGTAQGGGTGNNQIQLASGASSSNGTYDPGTVVITSGTGSGQARFIIDYVGATRTATVSRDWRTNPDATSEYIVLVEAQTPHVNEGLAQAGTSTTITLNSVASSVDDTYNGQIIHLVSGTGQDQARCILDYNGTTKVATVDPAWDTTPDTTTGYLMLPDANLTSERTVSYPFGVELDTSASNTNTLIGRDGTVGNPVSTLAAALTLASALNIRRIHLAAGSSITLTANTDNYELSGDNWTLALGGQSIANAFIMGATVSGVGTGSSPIFEDCIIGNVTLNGAVMRRCFFSGTITSGAAADWFLNFCVSRVAGTGTPAFDFGAALLNTNFNLRSYSGGIELQNMGGAGTDNASIEGNGQVVLNANCSGGTAAIRGNFTVTDNAGGAVTLSDDARFDVDQPWTATTRTLTANTNLNDPTAAAIATAVGEETITELSSIPAASPQLKQAVALLYMALRNKIDVTSSAKEVHNDAGTLLATKTLSDDGTTYSETKMA